MSFHRQVVINYREHSAKVDEGVALLVLALWQRGFRTISSCERDPNVHRLFRRLDGTSVQSEAAWVGFETLSQAKRFQRISRGRLVVPNAQDFKETSKAANAARYNMPGMAGVIFSFTDIPTVTWRVLGLRQSQTRRGLPGRR